MADGALSVWLIGSPASIFRFQPSTIGGGGEVVQQGQRFDVDALLGEVEQQAVLTQRKALEALRVGGEQLAQMQPGERPRRVRQAPARQEYRRGS